MKGKLRGLNKNSMIGVLPNVVNSNNETIKKEFDNIYDTENDVLIKSVNVPNGYVKSHWGDFVNLRVKTLSISDENFLEDMIERSAYLKKLDDRVKQLELKIENLSTPNRG